MSYRALDISSWKRRPHYEFFKEFDEPFFGLTFDVRLTEMYEWCKETGESLFLNYIYAALKAANEIEEFRYRMAEDEIRVYDQISISPTIARDDETFGFSYMEYYQDRRRFMKEAAKEVTRVRESDDLFPSAERPDTIHCTSLPWLKFTSLSHARNYRIQDSIPKIAFGKVFRENDDWSIPVSVHGHHALMDGIHVSKLAQKLEENLTSIKKFRED
ncbi:chloramphenicol acetyltransferase [Robertkochia aurantiaca]|uniref:chloramphenicol acetyltransferase n=1 Tax=Robertkochia aurantiaca TaxID=2873700 RepID=UPI001CC984D5|nr:chloramphenicol acetyltransferase [Robertkochia sp. 3YJGBD-33]